MVATHAPPVVLLAGDRERSPASVLESDWYTLVQVQTATQVLEWVRIARPDIIILDAELPDMSGPVACRLLRGDPRNDHSVPILIVAPDRPTHEQRVAALRAGAWDFLRHPGDAEELSLKLQAYLQAKLNIDLAIAEDATGPLPRVHDRPGLARRARELGSLMARTHGALACVVFTLEFPAAESEAGNLLALTSRLSDVVGTLNSGEYAVVAPETADAGAVKLAMRVAVAMRQKFGGADPRSSTLEIRAGYDAVDDLTYRAIDPVSLLWRAAQAVRSGKPEPGCSWVRRFDVTSAAAPDAAPFLHPSDVRRSVS